MKVKGIGNVTKKEILSVFTKEGIEAYKNGDVTEEELISNYKMQKVKSLSKIGSNWKTFELTWNRIPDILIENGSIEEISAVVDALHDAYCDGINKKRTE